MESCVGGFKEREPKMAFPIEPSKLPAEVACALQQIAIAWANHPMRPKPTAEVLEHWDKLIADWITDSSLPLFIRKAANNRGSVVSHSSGRTLIPCDNSPAHWALALAILGEMPVLSQVREMIDQDRIPIAMILKSQERAIAQFCCTLSQVVNPNSAGWKVAHIHAVGIANRTPVKSIKQGRLTGTLPAVSSAT